MRERYEDWLDDRLGVLRHKRERDRDMPAAEAKRERKAAKRRRDAELTRLGMELCRLSVVRTWDVRRTSIAFDARDLARYKREARRRGARQWWKVTARCLPPRSWATHKLMRAIRRGEVQP